MKKKHARKRSRRWKLNLSRREQWLALSLLFLLICSIYGVCRLSHCLTDTRRELEGWKYLYTNSHIVP